MKDASDKNGNVVLGHHPKIVKAMEKTVLDKDVTYDLERQIEGANLLKCSEFGDAIIKNMDKV